MRFKHSAEAQSLQRFTTTNLLLMFAVGSTTATPQNTADQQRTMTYPQNAQNYGGGLNNGALNLQNPQHLQLQQSNPYANTNQNSNYYPQPPYPPPSQYPQPPRPPAPQYPLPQPGNQYQTQPNPNAYQQGPVVPPPGGYQPVPGQQGYPYRPQYDPNNPHGNMYYSSANSIITGKSLAVMTVIILLSMIFSPF